MAQLERAGTGALLLCDVDRYLCGLLTDGDIRRAVLQGRSLDDPCTAIATPNPIKVPAPVNAEEALRIMSSLSQEELSDPQISTYYGISLAANGDVDHNSTNTIQSGVSFAPGSAASTLAAANTDATVNGPLFATPAGTAEVKTTTCYMCACRCGIRVHLPAAPSGGTA